MRWWAISRSVFPEDEAAVVPRGPGAGRGRCSGVDRRAEGLPHHLGRAVRRGVPASVWIGGGRRGRSAHGLEGGADAFPGVLGGSGHPGRGRHGDGRTAVTPRRLAALAAALVIVGTACTGGTLN